MGAFPPAITADFAPAVPSAGFRWYLLLVSVAGVTFVSA